MAVGRLVEKKGFGNLIEALRGVEDVPWSLTVVGDGPWRERLERQAAGLPVTFLGQRGKSEVLATLASATVVALPSVAAANGDQEGLPVTLLEAAAVGAAIVASDLPGIREVVRDDRSGLLVAPRRRRRPAGRARPGVDRRRGTDAPRGRRCHCRRRVRDGADRRTLPRRAPLGAPWRSALRLTRTSSAAGPPDGGPAAGDRCCGQRPMPR
ncbi:glycosyltransferase [Curtobacterium sp. MCJR17_043]|uniref:glycosyltransferase n=1 Tax=Curtobacterium sp. MCJR17_043 TaxID=2175660 RepID=UPI0024DFD3EB|nr:glycosyltransferase [Curtobacterium sp. MCJR17_043]WIB35298.1 glycosyltransferase [Curtobacterium sp. MCJR17_043]